MELEKLREGRTQPVSVGIILALLGVATVLRAFALGYEALWCDEAYTALTVRAPLAAMMERLWAVDDAPPLFYILEKLQTSIFGDNEASLRSVSVGAGVLSVALVLWFARQRRAGSDLWGATFLAIATTGIFHSRQARSYSVLFLAATGLVLSARAMLSGQKRAGLLLLLSSSTLCLTHHVGVILVLTSLVLWPLGTKRRPSLRVWVGWHAPALLIWATLWLGASAQLQVHEELNVWIAHYWETHPIFLAPFLSLGLFLPVGLPSSELSVGFATQGNMSGLFTSVSLVFGMICLGAAAFYVSRSRGQPHLADRKLEERHELLLETGFLLLPLLALMISSLIVTPVYVLGRTDVIAYPAFVLLIGRGLAGLPRKTSWFFLVFWAAMSLISLAPSYGIGNTHLAKGVDRRLAASLGQAGLAPDDWVIHTFMTSPTIEYYLERLGFPHQTGWYPLIAEQNTATDYPTSPDSSGAYFAEANELFVRMDDALPEDGDVWVFGVLTVLTDQTVAEVRTSGSVTCEQIGYPTSLLVYTLVGRAPVKVSFLYHQDWVAGERVVLRIPKETWIPREDLEAVDVVVKPSR